MIQTDLKKVLNETLARVKERRLYRWNLAWTPREWYSSALANRSVRLHRHRILRESPSWPLSTQRSRPHIWTYSTLLQTPFVTRYAPRRPKAARLFRCSRVGLAMIQKPERWVAASSRALSKQTQAAKFLKSSPSREGLRKLEASSRTWVMGDSRPSEQKETFHIKKQKVARSTEGQIEACRW